MNAYTDYLCSAQVLNSAGWSQESQEYVFRTLEDCNKFKIIVKLLNKCLIIKTSYSLIVPSPPSSIGAFAFSETKFQITWSEPKYPNGNILAYYILITRIGPKYKIPNHCHIRLPERNTTIINVGTLHSHIYPDGEPYTEYYVQLAAENLLGIGEYSSPLSVVTQASGEFT